MSKRLAIVLVYCIIAALVAIGTLIWVEDGNNAFSMVVALTGLLMMLSLVVASGLPLRQAWALIMWAAIASVDLSIPELRYQLLHADYLAWIFWALAIVAGMVAGLQVRREERERK